jgi:osmotically-inducible protein OsmY
MPSGMDRAFARRIEGQLVEAGLEVTVESMGGSLVLSGIVDSEEARVAASDIVAMAAPDTEIDNQIEVESTLPTRVSDFAADEPTAELSESSAYTPPSDPVLTTDKNGRPEVLGGFGAAATEDVQVERSVSDNRPGDEALAEAIRRELADDSATADLLIVVAVRNGVAHLRGRVPDLDDADNAEAVAARVPGVREVVEELDVTNV